jgi:ubiquitin carboxyl-terminal hydrolase 8
MSQNIGVCKLKNMGATCYMNSILHILQELPSFQEFILKNNFNKEIYDSLHQLFKLSSQNNDKVIIPTSFKKSIGNKSDLWEGYEQQDSQEFLCFLISSLEEEIGNKNEFIPSLTFNNNTHIVHNNANEMWNYTNKVSNNAHIVHNNTNEVSNNAHYILHNIISQKSWFNYQLREYSLLKNMFDGLTRTKKTCSICKNNQYAYEPFITLPLSIPLKLNKTEYDINDCFDNFIEIERLTSDNKLTCELCGIKNKFYTETKLWKTPDILVIQLKRFINNNIVSEKINEKVSYPLELNIENYFDNFSNYKNNSIYKLKGVNIHLSLGKNINFGHYVSFVKNKINNNWYIYNDENPIREIEEKDLIHNNAYLLFYIRG